MENLLDWLQQIYEEDFCNDSWEHLYGVTIETLDPGWNFKFEFTDTDLEDMDFKEILVRKDEKNWFQCWKKDGVFHGWGGARNLTNILEVFRDWYIESTQYLDANE